LKDNYEGALATFRVFIDQVGSLGSYHDLT